MAKQITNHITGEVTVWEAPAAQLKAEAIRQLVEADPTIDPEEIWWDMVGAGEIHGILDSELLVEIIVV